MINNVRDLNFDILDKQTKTSLTAHPLFALQSLIRGNTDLPILSIHILECCLNKSITVVHLKDSITCIRI